MPEQINYHVNQSTKIGNVFLNYINFDEQGQFFFGERRIELSMGHDFLNKFNPKTVIEVGSTMFNQGRRGHKVVDLYDTSHPDILNVDGAEFDYTGHNVVSISTIEHFDDVQIDGVWRTGVNMTDKGFLTVKRICETAKEYLLTFPVGIHKKLDELILKSDIKRLIIFRDQNNNWDGRENIDNINFEYDRPFPCSNALHVITNIENYHLGA